MDRNVVKHFLGTHIFTWVQFLNLSNSYLGSLTLVLCSIFMSVAAVARGNCYSCSRAGVSGNVIQALACNSHFEARGEGFDGMVEASRTVLARAESSKFPSNPIQVIFQRSQFSWTSYSRPICGSQNWSKALSAAQAAVREGSNGKLYYHNTSVRPRWSYNCSGRKQLGHHIFYSDCGPGGRRGHYGRRHSHGRRQGHHHARGYSGSRRSSQRLTWRRVAPSGIYRNRHSRH